MATVVPGATAAPAGFLIRTVAYVIDAVIVGVVASLAGGGTAVQSGDGVNYQMNGTGMLIGAAYFVGAWALFGTTIGMRVFGMRIVMAGGAKLTPVAAVIRFLGLILSFMVILIGVIWVAFDQHKQGWHDKLAGTYVIR